MEVSQASEFSLLGEGRKVFASQRNRERKSLESYRVGVGQELPDPQGFEGLPPPSLGVGREASSYLAPGIWPIELGKTIGFGVFARVGVPGEKTSVVALGAL